VIVSILNSKGWIMSILGVHGHRMTHMGTRSVMEDIPLTSIMDQEGNPIPYDYWESHLQDLGEQKPRGGGSYSQKYYVVSAQSESPYSIDFHMSRVLGHDDTPIIYFDEASEICEEYSSASYPSITIRSGNVVHSEPRMIVQKEIHDDEK
ncbi:hypothetical protein HAX54_028888, partial [Datura stramonium]|nr:hypothetical protein [Datura stramonium]